MTFEERRMLSQAVVGMGLLRDRMIELEKRIEALEARPKRGRPRKTDSFAVGVGANNG